MKNATRVLVTGAGGFIGHHLVHQLVKRGLDLVLFDNLSGAGADRNLEWLARHHELLVATAAEGLGSLRFVRGAP